eukprot:NODE_3813_length_912_cov_22.309386_g3507_i0.p1 GENE.NODE_3813_length_912_cov_22.309386_g3507_i0~~NODE_3813_length_912_cov_22.309386_g3507_i0.p1  ORF type:complete len:229 (+),score=39.01 NODE_3813_length_912_cov_22.309386_g3507_i0:115-801(+)
MMDGFWLLIDALSLLVSVAMFALYHWYIRDALKKNGPLATTGSAMISAYSQWTDVILSDPVKYGIIGLQTLRNHQQGSQLLASTSCLLALSVMGYASADIATERRIKLSLLACALLSAFFCYMSVLRLLIQISYFLQAEAIPKSLILEHFHKAAVYYKVANRSLYFAMPMGIWIILSPAMPVVTLLLVVALYHTDVTVFYGQDHVAAVPGDVQGEGAAITSRCGVHQA